MNYLITGHGINVHLNMFWYKKNMFFLWNKHKISQCSEDRNRDKLTSFSCEMQLSFSFKEFFFSEIMKFCVVR